MKKNTIVLSGKDEDFARIKKFCEDEGLYMGRWIVKTAIRAIEEIEHERTRKAVDRIIVSSGRADDR